MQLAACSAPANSGSDLNQELCRCSEAFPCVLGRLALPSSQWLLQIVFILPKLLSPDFPLIRSRPLCLPFIMSNRGHQVLITLFHHHPKPSPSALPVPFSFLSQKTRDAYCWPRLSLAFLPPTLSGSPVAYFTCPLVSHLALYWLCPLAS